MKGVASPYFHMVEAELKLIEFIGLYLLCFDMNLNIFLCELITI